MHVYALVGLKSNRIGLLIVELRPLEFSIVSLIKRLHVHGHRRSCSGGRAQMATIPFFTMSRFNLDFRELKDFRDSNSNNGASEK